MINLKSEDKLNNLKNEMIQDMMYCPYCNKKQLIVIPPYHIVYEGFFRVKYGFYFKQKCFECGKTYEKKKLL